MKKESYKSSGGCSMKKAQMQKGNKGMKTGVVEPRSHVGARGSKKGKK